MRLPNVFTAFADIALGALAMGSWPSFPGSYLLLFIASGCLYSGGMVWNDFFDVEQDRRERPFRPIPSGRVSRAAAARLGTILLLLGISLATLAASTNAEIAPRMLLLSLSLAACILLYDAWFKRTPFGPIAMGSCRFLNVLLGLSLGGIMVGFKAIHIPLIVGLYIVGVTWFARTEARMSNKNALRGAALVMLAALALALPLPVHVEAGRSSPMFPYLLVGFGFFVGFPVWHAVEKPIPRLVQVAVKRSVLGLIILDAVLATAWAGWMGLFILLLLPPALYLGKWIYST